MIYPLLPSFLSSVLKTGPAFLGLIEGAAEALASVLRLVAGRLSDRAPRRKPFVVFGYGLSTLARPLVAVAVTPLQVLAVRLADRFGKGVRSAPRDAMLASVVAPAERGRAYGFHRAMDHTGATIGPLLASAALFAGLDLRTVFALAWIPGLLAFLALVFGVKEDRALAPPEAPVAPATDPRPQGASPTRRPFRAYLFVLALFALGNSSDAFLLLRAQELGVTLAFIPLLWTFHHVVKAGLSTLGGAFSDRAGRRRAIVLGWAIFALSYLGFARARGPVMAFALFAVYGLFHVLTEGPEKALVADLSGATERGRAFGLYHAVTGAMILPGNLLTGFLWQRYGASLALTTGASLAALAAAGLLLAVRTSPVDRSGGGV